MIEHYSKNIQNVIQKELFRANKSIKIAVAWFTNDLLFQPLLLKLGTGVLVELILNDDEINNSESNQIDFDQFVRLGGILRWNGPDRLLHEKFCIIDDSIVISGSYNWTNKAEYNRESISVIREDSQSVLFFTDEFHELCNDTELHEIADFEEDEEDEDIVSESNEKEEHYWTEEDEYEHAMSCFNQLYASSNNGIDLPFLDLLVDEFDKLNEKGTYLDDIWEACADFCSNHPEIQKKFPYLKFDKEAWESMCINGYLCKVRVRSFPSPPPHRHRLGVRYPTPPNPYKSYPKKYGFQHALVEKTINTFKKARYFIDGYDYALNLDSSEREEYEIVLLCHSEDDKHFLIPLNLFDLNLRTDSDQLNNPDKLYASCDGYLSKYEEILIAKELKETHASCSYLHYDPWNFESTEDKEKNTIVLKLDSVCRPPKKDKYEYHPSSTNEINILEGGDVLIIEEGSVNQDFLGVEVTDKKHCKMHFFRKQTDLDYFIEAFRDNPDVLASFLVDVIGTGYVEWASFELFRYYPFLQHEDSRLSDEEGPIPSWLENKPVAGNRMEVCKAWTITVHLQSSPNKGSNNFFEL